MDEIVCKGRKFLVKTGEITNEFESQWILTTSRGKVYRLWRNQKNPHMLFPVCETGFMGAGGLPNLWFTDKDGQLKACS